MLVILSYAWVALMTVMAGYGGLANIFTGKFSDGLGIMLMGTLFASPAILIIWLNKRARKKEQEINRKITEEITKSCGGKLPRFSHFQDLTAIALNEAKQEIVLGNPAGIVKSYPYAAIREWEIRSETAGQSGVVAGGSGGAGAAMLAAGVAQSALNNISAQAQAKANSGLFLNVKDIEYPEWRISLQSQADRKRWFEILNQAINEGGVA